MLYGHLKLKVHTIYLYMYAQIYVWSMGCCKCLQTIITKHFRIHHLSQMVALGFGGMGTPHFLHGSFTVTGS